MTRNTIGVPPLEPRESHESSRARLTARPHVAHPGMDPSVVAGSRVGDVPDLASRDVTERDTPVSLYIAIVIVAIVAILAIMFISSFF